MSENITLKIFTPLKVALNRKAYRVVLPYGKVNITLQEGYAPTSFYLQAGAVQILDSENKTVAVYFIDEGIADIAENTCTVSTKYFLAKNDVSLPNALEKAQTDDKKQKFYQAIAEYLTAHGEL